MSPIASTSDGNQNRVIMKLVSDEDTKQAYENDFELKLSIQLVQGDNEDVLVMAMRVSNVGNADMEFTTAFHSMVTLLCLCFDPSIES